MVARGAVEGWVVLTRALLAGVGAKMLQNVVKVIHLLKTLLN